MGSWLIGMATSQPEVAVLHGSNRMERLFLDAGRALILTGAALVISTVGDPGPDAAHAFIGFLLLLLGVSLVTLSAVAAGRLPGAKRVGAAVESTVAILITGSGRLLISTAASVLIYYTAASPSAVDGLAACATLAAFLLFLLGVWLELLAVAADRLRPPGRARIAAEPVARTFKGHSFGEFLRVVATSQPEVAVLHGSNRMERLFLDAGRALILTGTVLVISTVGDPGPDAARGFTGFLLLLLGVSLVTLSAVAGGRLPGAERVGTAVESIVAVQPVLIMNSGRLLISTAGSVLIYYTAASPSAVDGPAACATLAAFILFLLGVCLELLALAADRLRPPGCARIAAVPVARTFRGHSFGGTDSLCVPIELTQRRHLRVDLETGRAPPHATPTGAGLPPPDHGWTEPRRSSSSP